MSGASLCILIANAIGADNPQAQRFANGVDSRGDASAVVTNAVTGLHAFGLNVYNTLILNDLSRI